MNTTTSHPILRTFAWSIALFFGTVPAIAQPDSTQATLVLESPSFEISWGIDDFFPGIETVAEKFSETYGVQSERYLVNFEKRQEGYFVALIKPEDYPKVSRREIFWSALDREWKPLSLKKQPFREEYASELTRDKFYFHRMPYYGYPGWYRDVIEKWEGKGRLSDVLQFSLATAWYHRAASLLSNQYGMADSLDTFVLPNTKNALSPEQLETYLRYMNRSLEHYETLARQYPDYETVVGPATVKLADQYMTAFMQLHYFQNEETALKIIDRPPLSFNEFLLESSRNLLQSCPKNAILLTYGDNDTYPLWYVQAKQGFRRDVVVANLSLLATGRYINHLRDRIFDAPPLKYQISPEFYYSDSSTVVYLEHNGQDLSLPDFFACATSKRSERSFGYPLCEVNSVHFWVDKTGKVLPSAPKNAQKGSKVEIALSAKKYLIRDQLAVLDLLYSNTPDRPLCFATTCRGDYMEPFEKHLRLQGLVYRFDPKPMAVPSADLHGAIDLERSYEVFAKKMTFTSSGPITFDGDPYLNINQVYRLFTARELAAKGQKKKAVELLDQYFAAFPNERVPFNRMALYMAEVYGQAGKAEKGAAVALKVLDNFESDQFEWTGYEELPIAIIRKLAEESKDQVLLRRLKRYTK